MSIVSYLLEEVLLAFTALSAIHTGFELIQLSAVTGITLCALAGFITAVTAVTGLTGLVAFTAGALTAVTVCSCNSCNVTGVCTVAGALTAVGGIVHQWLVCLTLSSGRPVFDRSAGGGGLFVLDLCAVILCTVDFDDTCKLLNKTLLRRRSRALSFYLNLSRTEFRNQVRVQNVCLTFRTFSSLPMLSSLVSSIEFDCGKRVNNMSQVETRRMLSHTLYIKYYRFDQIP